MLTKNIVAKTTSTTTTIGYMQTTTSTATTSTEISTSMQTSTSENQLLSNLKIFLKNFNFNLKMVKLKPQLIRCFQLQ